MSGSRGNFLYISKDFMEGTNIHHSDIKNALVQILIFLLTKNCFLKLAKFFETKCL